MPTVNAFVRGEADGTTGALAQLIQLLNIGIFCSHLRYLADEDSKKDISVTTPEFQFVFAQFGLSIQKEKCNYQQ